MPLPTILRTVEKREPGPSPRFSRAHVVLAFITIGSLGTVGRQTLAESSGLGEGSIRTVLKRFQEEGLVATNTLGCYLTPRGARAYKSMMGGLSQLLPMEGGALTVGASQVAILARSSDSAVGNGIEQRDSAIRVGASGATTYVIKSDRFSIPGGSEDCEKEFPSRAWGTLRKELRPRNGDVIVVCGAGDETTAKLGALSAALTLL